GADQPADPDRVDRGVERLQDAAAQDRQRKQEERPCDRPFGQNRPCPLAPWALRAGRCGGIALKISLAAQHDLPSGRQYAAQAMAAGGADSYTEGTGGAYTHSLGNEKSLVIQSALHYRV